MSKRLDVLAAVKAMIAAAVPIAVVRGMDTDEAKPAAVGAGGMIIVRSGDPGTPDVDLSPPTYNYEHSIPIEVASFTSGSLTAQQTMDVMMVAIGEAIEADRTLGGLVDYLEAEMPTDGESDERGVKPIGWADFMIIATYSTTNPLT